MTSTLDLTWLQLGVKKISYKKTPKDKYKKAEQDNMKIPEVVVLDYCLFISTMYVNYDNLHAWPWRFKGHSTYGKGRHKSPKTVPPNGFQGAAN